MREQVEVTAADTPRRDFHTRPGGTGQLWFGQFNKRRGERGVNHVELNGAHGGSVRGQPSAFPAAAPPGLQSNAVKVPDTVLSEVRERGFALMEAFLEADELKAAQEALWLHFPTPENYFADPSRHAVYSTSQFAGVEEFPYRSWDLNRLAIHPDLINAVERYLGTAELHLYKVELWAKYAGAVNYEQPLHRDFGSHSLVVPRLDDQYQQITTFIYLSDVTEEDGPTRIVPFDLGEHVPFTPLYIGFGELAEREVPALGPAGSLLMYRTDILHRGSDFTGEQRSRFSLLADYQARGATWAGKMAWPKQSPERWAKFIPQCSVRERDVFGFPRPGDPYWNEQTLADTAARYPGMDMSSYA